MTKNPSSKSQKQPASTPRFRGILHAVDQFLKTISPSTPEHVVLKYFRKHAIGPDNAKCWKKEIHPHLRKCGHGGYKKTDFQTRFLQFCRKNDFFIASCHMGFYLPSKPEDFEPYLTATARRIRGEQANLRAAIRLGRLQAESNTSRKAVAAKRPATTRSPRKIRSKSRRPTLS